jgi:hypothetical protein
VRFAALMPAAIQSFEPPAATKKTAPEGAVFRHGFAN